MSTLIKNIAKQYPHLSAEKVTRAQAFGVVYNNTTVNGAQLNSHASGKKVTAAVLDYMGFPIERTTHDVKGNLDDF